MSNPTNISDSLLTSPAFNVNQGNRRIQFRNNFNLESGFDGGVLEISINGGAFADLLAAGGTFISGGYTSTIDNRFGSPVAGRRAWSGNSVGYITSIAELPASALGNSVRLRFRMASDNSDAVFGWRVDTIQACGFVIPNLLTITATDASKNEGNSGTTPFTYTVSRVGDLFTTVDVQYAVSGSSGNPASAGDFGDALPGGTISFGVGETVKTLTIDVAGDTLSEPDEGFTVTLSDATGNSSIQTASALARL